MHDKQALKNVSHHIEDCESCKAYFDENLKTKRIIELAQKEPELQNPENLTNSILDAIDDVKQIPEQHLNIANPKTIRLIRKTLAAASISLMLIFTVEQYMVFDKISKLEEYVSEVPNQHKNRSFKNIFRYNSGIPIESFNKIFNKKNRLAFQHKLKTKIMYARLSALAINELDNQKINQFIKSGLDPKTIRVFH
ncbi:MAG: hypothetical protein DRJ05_07510 [Bacteroidetes bacterium]|nr:MAG: hypothetical protein DRJ05_07510 [Bacteroidota bacterium]